MPVSHRLDTAAVAALLRSPAGPVARDILRRGKRVEAAAKRLCPVDSGRLRSSIDTELRGSSAGPVARIGTNVEYAEAVHNGTGIYGPKGAPIRPKRKKVLMFKVGGEVVFARSVKGMKPRPFLVNALPAAKG